MTWMRNLAALAVFAAGTIVGSAGSLGGDMVETSPWMVTQTVEVMGHSPHESVRLYELGSIDALGFRPHGGDVYCFYMEIRMADGRRILVENRSFGQGEVGEFEMSGTNRRIDRVEFNCHPRFGVMSLDLEILVR